jgi:uncharacterized phage-associated protein
LGGEFVECTLSVFDVAAYFLHMLKDVTAMKLEKLCYYAQAWSLAWDDVPLFEEDFEAWANGPVCRELYNRHCGLFILNEGFFGECDLAKFSPTQIETLEAIVRDYGDMDPLELSNLSHIELPWREARIGVAPGVRSENIISKEAMEIYYNGLMA